MVQLANARGGEPAAGSALFAARQAGRCGGNGSVRSVAAARAAAALAEGWSELTGWGLSEMQRILHA